MDAAIATIGHNSLSFRQQIEGDPDLVYRDSEALDKAIAEIKANLAKAEIDLVTSKGRSDIASRAAELSRLKVQIEQAGLKRTEEWRKSTDGVNSVKNKVKVGFDALRDKAREPLTKWEEERDRREEQIGKGIANIDALGSVSLGATIAEIEKRVADLSAIPLTDEMFGAHLLIAEAKVGRSKNALEAALARARADERDRAELARLRAEAEKRDAQDRERLAKEKAEQDERDRKDKQEAAGQSRIKRAADDAAEAERRRLEKEAADKRVEEERMKAEAERRARDFEHREKVLNEVRAGIQEIGIGGPLARKLVEAIAAGTIPHVSVKF